MKYVGKNLSLVKKVGDKTQFTITRFHCTYNFPLMKKVILLRNNVKYQSFDRHDNHLKVILVIYENLDFRLV